MGHRDHGVEPDDPRPSRPRRRGGAATAMVAAICTFALAAGGCVPDPGQPRPLGTAYPVAAPATPADRAEAAAIEDVMAVYHSFREAEDMLSLRPQPSAEVLAILDDYLADPLLVQAWAALATIHQEDLRRAGKPASRAEIVELQLAQPPYTATIHECLDLTDAPLVHAGSGQPVGDDLPAELYLAASQPGRHVRVLAAKRYDDGRWLLEQGQWKAGEEC
jgi:hypothetical protein